MKDVPFGSRLTTLVLITLFGVGIGVLISPLSAQQSGERSGPETDTYRPGERMNPRRMMEIHRRMMDRRQSMQLELEKKLRAMDKARGDEKMEAMADVIREVVHQRREMMSMMNAMHQRMHGMHMMMQGQNGIPRQGMNSGRMRHHGRQ